jgi:hypothetical protein
LRHMTVRVKQRQMNLYPVSDVQTGAAGVDVEGFAEYVREAVADPIGRLVGIGDYTDSMSPSNRALLDVAEAEGRLYDTSREALTRGAFTMRDEFTTLVEPSIGRWDFLLKGHHKYDYKVHLDDGTWSVRSTDHDIAEYVGAPYLGEAGKQIGSAMVKYVFPARKRGGPEPVLKVYAVHGQGGGGGSFAGPLNQLEKMMRAFTADIYIVAHHHKAVVARAVKLSENDEHETHLRATDSLLVCAGSWMRSYMPNEVTYAEDGLLVPLAIGAPTITVSVKDDDTFKIRAIV